MGRVFNAIVKVAAAKSVIGATGAAVSKVATSVAEASKEKELLREARELSTIRVPRASVEFPGQNYQDVYDEFIAYGFTNVALLQKRDLIKGWFTKDGTVSSVTVNGDDSFKKKAKYPPDVRVVITYHTLK